MDEYFNPGAEAEGRGPQQAMKGGAGHGRASMDEKECCRSSGSVWGAKTQRYGRRVSPWNGVRLDLRMVKEMGLHLCL